MHARWITRIGHTLSTLPFVQPTTCAEEVNSWALTSLASLNSEIKAEHKHTSPRHILTLTLAHHDTKQDCVLTTSCIWQTGRKSRSERIYTLISSFRRRMSRPGWGFLLCACAKAHRSVRSLERALPLCFYASSRDRAHLSVSTWWCDWLGMISDT